ncbi:type I-E CRISPR-associated protein Cas6/Cse3/CasE [Leptolyngbya sp. 7M]|uniref:type I-E CRISPR-associated protein Cas6/Cse3/CasE n=1 Tax=Leptolyngbya sp. 7M TaxID=2812896 RepID=UPI001B8AEDF8|nr:type I-E CRISPR-associated protein Cas6/Cse3/CasE [Leptolyngbya sp. 7M]QYO66151.1 type I-E CRISPR-associated protein Cas6/Cse3/CasE [Leptolyngbya sp. 7M]
MELYLSRLYLNHRSRAVMKDVSDPRMLHRTISGCFPAIEGQEDRPQHERETPRSAFNILHRLERRRDGFVLYVQSTAQPDWSLLTPGYANRIDLKPINGAYSNIANGTRLVFRLAANPTKRAGKKDEGQEKFRDEKRRRIDIRDDEGRIRWLERKGADCGFSLCRVTARNDVAAVDAIPRPAVRFRHDTGRVTLGSAIFDGVLEVTDADAFRSALAKGIGTGKAYGFGLISVAPAR